MLIINYNIQFRVYQIHFFCFLLRMKEKFPKYNGLRGADTWMEDGPVRERVGVNLKQYKLFFSCLKLKPNNPLVHKLSLRYSMSTAVLH